MATIKNALFRLVVPALAAVATVNAATYDATPEGSPYSIAKAIEAARPGDTINLGDGTYDEPIVTVRDGKEGSPIVIVGSSRAIVNGDFDDRLVTVRHSWITLKGFTADCEVSGDDSRSSFVDKGVYVWGLKNPKTVSHEGGESYTSLIGFVMQDVTVKNCGGECVRLKNFVTNAQLLNNVVEHCGVHDYRYDDGGKNGEAIYLGTSSTQWKDGPDGTTDNLISGNTMTPHGSECVDIKEGAYNNIVENNDCREERDENSGCYGSRGDKNVFRNNVGTNCDGAGVRLGGWEVDGHQYGQHCDVYNNDFTNTGAGVLIARQAPQGNICGNTCSDGSCNVTGSDEIQDTWDQPCSDDVEDTGDVDSGDEDRDGEEKDQEEGEDKQKNKDKKNKKRQKNEKVNEDEEVDEDKDGNEDNEDASSSSSCQPIEILSSYLSGSGTTEKKNPVEHVIDGSLKTRWSAEGHGSWMAIDLPAPTTLSGMEAAFKNGTTRTQAFELVLVGETEVSTMVHTSSGTTDDLQLFSFSGDVRVTSVLFVGYGNDANDWNSVTEINLCGAGGDESRKLTDGSPVTDGSSSRTAEKKSESSPSSPAARARTNLRGSSN